MIIRRLDVFFRTQLTLDTPNFFNSVANVALAPLQHLIGQNKYQSLQGKVTLLKSDPSTSLTVVKIVIFIGAVFALALTPIGIAARYCSLLSPDVKETYSIAFLLQMDEADRPSLLKQFSPEVQAKFLSLDVHQVDSIAYLLQNASEYDKLKPFLSPTLVEAYTIATKPSPNPTSPPSPRSPLASPSDDLQPQPPVAQAEETPNPTIPAAVPRTLPVPAAQPNLEQFRKLEELLLFLTILQFGPPSHSNPFNCDKNVETIGKEISSTIYMINRLFKTLLKESDPDSWLEKGSKTPLYLNYCPFATSHFFTMHLENATCLNPHLDQALMDDWKVNYEKCLLLLKEKKLDSYNETAFPFSEEVRPKIEMLEKLRKLTSPDTPEAKVLKKQMIDFPVDPQKAIREIQIQNPELAEMMSNLFKRVSVQRSEISDGLGQIMLRDIKPFIPFFKNLDQQLTSHPNDRAKIEAWLKTEASKTDYPTPFFEGRHFMHRLAIVDMPKEELLPAINSFISVFNHCCRQLAALGLGDYIAEGPSLKEIVSCAVFAVKEKDTKQKILSDCLSILSPLATELKKLDEDLQANRQIIISWFERVKEERKDYFNPFEQAYDIDEYHQAYEGILDGAMVQQLRVLYPFCRDQLLALGLEKYLYEPIAPKNAPWSSERMIAELSFFEAMLSQTYLDSWLKKIARYSTTLFSGQKKGCLKSMPVKILKELSAKNGKCNSKNVLKNSKHMTSSATWSLRRSQKVLHRNC